MHLCKINKDCYWSRWFWFKFKVIDDSESVYSLGYYRRIGGGGGYYFRDYNGNNLGTGTTYITLEYELECQAGDLVYFKMLHGSTGLGYPTNWNTTFNYIQVDKYGWGNGTPVTYDKILPKNIKIKDFLKDLFLMFNLYVDISKDEAKKLIIETRDTYYNTGSVKDWSEKLSIGTDIKYSHPQQYQSYINKLKYNTDDDYHNKVYESAKDIQKNRIWW